MSMKYKLTKETKVVNGHTLHRIKCITSFGDVKKGDLGGWIESEKNLSHEGICWVAEEAKVYGDAKVFGKAGVYGNAEVYDNAFMYGSAYVMDYARVYENARVYGNAEVYGKTEVFGYAEVYDNAGVFGNARVCGNAKVYGRAVVDKNANISKDSDYIVLKNTWSSFRYFTYTKSNKMWTVGCFHGTGEELIKKAYADNKLKGKCYEASVKYVEQIMKFIEEEK